MTMNRVFYHLAKFLKGIALGGNPVAQCRGHVATIDFILLHFKNNLTHEVNLTEVERSDQGNAKTASPSQALSSPPWPY